MNSIPKFILIVVFLVSNACKSQYLVKKINEAPNLVAKKNFFVEKPLSEVLNQIKPSIKRVIGRPSESNAVRLGYLVFSFVDEKAFIATRRGGKYPIEITVYVKEPFEWDRFDWPIEKRLLWTKSDAEKYGHLTVVDIRVTGEGTK